MRRMYNKRLINTEVALIKKRAFLRENLALTLMV